MDSGTSEASAARSMPITASAVASRPGERRGSETGTSAIDVLLTRGESLTLDKRRELDASKQLLPRCRAHQLIHRVSILAWQFKRVSAQPCDLVELGGGQRPRLAA